MNDTAWYPVPLLELDPTHASHEHRWVSTRDALGCVGTLYPNVFPQTCYCGALRKYDGTVLPARLS